MIFLTVGTQLPFDRLVRAVDEWSTANPESKVFGQIADPGPDGYRPSHFEWKSFIEPAEFDRCFEEAELIIAHAGMGSIITALTVSKPVLIMPRRAELKEQRNDHQLATAARFQDRPGVQVAPDETAVGQLLDQWRSQSQTGAGKDNPGSISPYASPELLDCLRTFIHEG